MYFSISLYSPSEKTWTYKCINHRCVRQHHAVGRTNEKRIPFATCSMLCGGYTKIWPEPKKSYIGTSANSFWLMNVQYKIKTPYKNVESLLESAFSIFMDELHKIFHSSSSSSNDERSTSSSTVRLNKDERETDLASSHGSKKYNNNHSTINIFLYVLKTSDIHLSLSSDECYNITLTREFNKTILNASIDLLF